MFMSDGENVDLAEIEFALIADSGITEVVVVRINNTQLGEVGHAAIAAVSSDPIT